MAYPSFPFYPGDYLTGTMTFTAAERGAYMDCLCYQWECGGVPGGDFKRLARVMRMSQAEARRIWPVISAKFQQGPDGLYRNERLEVVRAEKDEFAASASARGAKGAAKRWLKHGSSNGRSIAEASVKHEPSNAQAMANDGSSIFEVQEERTRTRASRDPFGFRLSRSTVAFIAGAEGQIVEVPESWVHRACREFALTPDALDVFYAWAGEWVRRSGYDPPGGNKLAWLDARLAEWRTARTASASSDTAVEATQRLLRDQEERRAAILRERANG